MSGARSEAELRVILAPVVNDRWPMDRLLAFCAAWYRGDTTTTMGKALGVTKSGIIGKASRLAACGVLEHRPNPREPNPDQSPEAKRQRQRRAEAAYRRKKQNAEFAETQSRRLVPTALNRPAAPRPAPPPTAHVPPPKYGRIAQCCWPIGEPGTREFHFCDVPSEPGRPYCRDHAGHAYVRVPTMTAQRARA